MHTDVPRVDAHGSVGDAKAVFGNWEVAVVVGCDGVIVGDLRPEVRAVPDDVPVTQVMYPAPPTVRPSIAVGELARSMDDSGQKHILVSNTSGVLIGLVRRTDLGA